MNGAFIVFTTIVLVLYVFVILVVLTPWFGMGMIPYMVIFTFAAAAIILSAVYAYDQLVFDNLGWESVLIFTLLSAAFLVVIFVIWYFIHRRSQKSHEVPRVRDEDTNIPTSPGTTYNPPYSSDVRTYHLSEEMKRDEMQENVMEESGKRGGAKRTEGYTRDTPEDFQSRINRTPLNLY